MEISEEIQRAYKVARVLFDPRALPDMLILADALRDTLARALKAEFWSEHPRCGKVCNFSPCKDYQHQWTNRDWRDEADDQLKGDQ